MTLTLDRASLAEVHEVALAMRESDFREFSAVAWADTREDLADQLTDRYAGRSDVLCARGATPVPIAIGGALLLRPKVATLLFFATDEFSSIALPLTRWIRKSLFPRLAASGVHRIEAVAMVEHVASRRWMQSLGLHPETGPLLNYGKRGEAFVQFSESFDVRPAGS